MPCDGEVKVGEFKPEYAGKMQFYLAALDDLVRMPQENPSIGIILCKAKNRVVVEYALRESKKPIGVAFYAVHEAKKYTHRAEGGRRRRTKTRTYLTSR